MAHELNGRENFNTIRNEQSREEKRYTKSSAHKLENLLSNNLLEDAIIELNHHTKTIEDMIKETSEFREELSDFQVDSIRNEISFFKDYISNFKNELNDWEIKEDFSMALTRIADIIKGFDENKRGLIYAIQQIDDANKKLDEKLYYLSRSYENIAKQTELISKVDLEQILHMQNNINISFRNISDLENETSIIKDNFESMVERQNRLIRKLEKDNSFKRHVFSLGILASIGFLSFNLFNFSSSKSTPAQESVREIVRKEIIERAPIVQKVEPTQVTPVIREVYQEPKQIAPKVQEVYQVPPTKIIYTSSKVEEPIYKEELGSITTTPKEDYSPKEYYNLGLDYLFGRNDSQKDTTKAIKFLERSATLGVVEAQFSLGNIYYNGINGITKDIAKAIKNWTLAGNNNHLDANLRMASLYYNGLDTRKDHNKAFMHYSLAASHGNSQAQYMLAKMYKLGQGVLKDKKLAREWLFKASNNGHSSAKKDLDKLIKEEIKE